jgi:pimeloyl-ACP methyl ester carboxylesterase
MAGVLARMVVCAAVVVGAVGAGCALSGCGALEERFIMPTRHVPATPPDARDAWIPLVPKRQGVGDPVLHAWVYPAPASARGEHGRAPAIVFFHGAATSLDDVGEPLKPVVEKAGATLVLASYRGFGRSSEPSQLTRDTMVEDGLAVVDAVRAMPGVDPERVAVFGYSFGGMTSLAVGRARPWVRPVVTGGAFSSSGMALRDRDVQWLALFAGPRHEPIANIRRLSGRRVLLFHPLMDTMVPMDHAIRLLRAGQAAGARVNLYVATNATHFDFLSADPRVLDVVARACREEWGLAVDESKMMPPEELGKASVVEVKPVVEVTPTEPLRQMKAGG